MQRIWISIIFLFLSKGLPLWLRTSWGQTVRRTSTYRQMESAIPSLSPSPLWTSLKQSCSFKTLSHSVRKMASTLWRPYRWLSWLPSNLFVVTHCYSLFSFYKIYLSKCSIEIILYLNLIPAIIQSFESQREKEQVCATDSNLWGFPLRAESPDGVLSLRVHLHPNRQTHLQPRRHWWGKENAFELRGSDPEKYYFD